MSDRWMMRCEAECLVDVARLVLALTYSPHNRGSMMAPCIYQGSMYSNVKLTWQTMVPEARMREILKDIPDSHVMLRTLTYDEVFDGACS